MILYWYIYDIVVFILEPLMYSYNKLSLLDFPITDLKAINKIKTYYSWHYYTINNYNPVNVTKLLNTYPDILTIENSTITIKTQLYCTIIMTIPILIWILLRLNQKSHFSIYIPIIYSCNITYNHFVIIPLKINQVLNDYLETEYLFNFQFTIDFYIQRYFQTLLLSILLYIVIILNVHTIKKTRSWVYLFITAYAYLLLTLDLNNPLNSLININVHELISVLFFYVMLYEIIYYMNVCNKQLEMTGIEPA